jgi:hypothetical protein
MQTISPLEKKHGFNEMRKYHHLIQPRPGIASQWVLILIIDDRRWSSPPLKGPLALNVAFGCTFRNSTRKEQLRRVRAIIRSVIERVRTSIDEIPESLNPHGQRRREIRVQR